MTTDYRDKLREIRTFPSLVKFLREDLDWPVASADFEESTFDYTPEELGIDAANAAKIEEIKRLRPLVANQPWGIFFVKFEPKQLPVVALRRILNGVVMKQRATPSAAEHPKWPTDDLLFISNYGEGSERRISFAHFSRTPGKPDLPTLKVLAWDDLDTPLHLDHAANTLVERLAWPAPEDEWDDETWRERWSSAFELRNREVITTSKNLAVNLAKLARTIRDRIKSVLAIETEDGPVAGLLKAFQTALVHDLDADTFADMYAQTIAYGLLTARVTNPGPDALGGTVLTPVTNPFLKELLETFLGAEARTGGINFDELGVSEVVDLLDDANMEAVVRDFGDKNPQEDPVIHFYELFLKEYDAKKRMQRGVFYTPRPVVSYIMRSIDELLRSEFGLEEGLADTSTWAEVAGRHKGVEIPDGVLADQPFVTILDPAVGTGTFLVEAVDIIHRTLTSKWTEAGHSEATIGTLWNEYVPRHLLPRLYGYELLMAPYVIAHLKFGLKLHETGYRFDTTERARIYLTNALEPPDDFSGRLEFAIPALAHEAQAVNEVKTGHRFTVVIGNPPYAIHSGNLSASVRSMVDRYRRVAGEAIRERGALQFEKNIQNDYVKFIRLSEIIIAKSSAGVVGFVTSHAFLTNRTLRGMRESLTETFSLLRFLNLHGNASSGEAAVLAPDDENVFEITEGVAVSLMTRKLDATPASLGYTDLAGKRSYKYSWLLSESVERMSWELFTPMLPNLIFKPKKGEESLFERGIPLDAIFPQRSAGVITARDAFATDENKEALVDRVERFARSPLSGAELRMAFGIKDKKGWDVDSAQRQARADMPLRRLVYPYSYRPFDARLIAYNRGIVWGMAYPTLKHTLSGTNLVLIGMQQYQYDIPEYCYVFVTRSLTDSRMFVSKTGVASLFPLYLEPSESELIGKTANLSAAFVSAIENTTGLSSIPEVVGDPHALGTVGPETVLAFIYAQLYAPSYRSMFREALRSSYPHVLLPANREVFGALARIGVQLIDLHLMEAKELENCPSRYQGKQAPVVGRVGWSDGTVWLDGATAGAVANGFGEVSEAAWNFHIGGYQVCHKWLKDRKGRTLSGDDIAHYEKIVCAISETIRLMGVIDQVIDEHGGWPNAFGLPSTEAAA